MESFVRTENDPRALLLPEAVPVLPSVDVDDENSSSHFPSTVDIAALIVSHSQIDNIITNSNIFYITH